MIDKSLIIGNEALLKLNEFVHNTNFSSIFILTDENTSKHCLPTLTSFSTFQYVEISIKAGENYKNIDTCETIWNTLLKNNADRKSLLICLGGGVIGDMGAFCASVFMRGIEFVLVPTTLLAITDASIGGKTGIDFNNYKNIIGTFSNKHHTFIYPEFLKTLTLNELKSGFAEMIKHSLIYSKAYWDEIKNADFTIPSFQILIGKSIAIKQEIVNTDPKEKGFRKILNFGHTIGHAIESYFLEIGKPILHGEAVVHGIIAECFISNKMGKLSELEFREITNYLLSKYTIYKLDKITKIANYTYLDKKNESQIVQISTIESIGNPIYNIETTPELISESLHYLNSLN